MAALLQAQGKMAAAEEHMRRALSIREDALGPDHPLVSHAIPIGKEGNKPTHLHLLKQEDVALCK